MKTARHMARLIREILEDHLHLEHSLPHVLLQPSSAVSTDHGCRRGNCPKVTATQKCKGAQSQGTDKRIRGRETCTRKERHTPRGTAGPSMSPRVSLQRGLWLGFQSDAIGVSISTPPPSHQRRTIQASRLPHTVVCSVNRQARPPSTTCAGAGGSRVP